MRWTALLGVLVFPTVCLAQAPALDRLSRLEILADMWSKAYVYHPHVATGELDYNQVLQNAIPLVERAKSDAEFVRVINEQVLAPLNDVQSSAQIATPERCGPVPSGPPRDLEAKMVSPGTAIVRVPDPRLEADRNRQNLFLDRFRSAVQRLGKVDRLIVDLRYQVDVEVERWTSYWLGLFTDKPLEQAYYLRRLHEGFNEFNSANNALRQRWQVDGGDELRRAAWDGVVRDPILTPVLFVVNNASYVPLARMLDTLQRAGRAAVIWEDSGCVVGSAVDRYPNNIRFYLNPMQLLGREGGARPDRAFTAHLGDDRLPGIAQDLLAGLSARKENALDIPPLRLRPFTSSMATLADRNQRVFWVIKVWMTIRYYFPHLEYASIDWTRALRDWIPRFEAVSTADGLFDMLEQMAAPLNDSHIGVAPPFFQSSDARYYPSFRLSRIEGKVIVSAAGDEAKPEVMVGDEVVSIDGKKLDQIEAFMRAHISASTEGAFFREWNRQTGGKRDTDVTLTVNRNGTQRTVAVTRTRPQPFIARSMPMRALPAGIGYIDLTALQSLEELATQFNRLRDSRGLLLDLRGYTPYGNARRFLAERLYDHPVPLQISEIPLVQRHSFGPSTTYLQLSEYAQPSAAGSYRGPVVVLINADAQSTPESTCLDISTDHRVTFVGSPTTGTTGGQTDLALPGGWRLTFTSTRVRYPDGRRFQDIGILPDVYIEPTVAGIIAGRDEVFDKGLEVLISKAPH